MRSVNRVLHLLTLLALIIAEIQMASAGSSYKINPGDVLRIDIWNEESLTREVLVRPDGYISFPLAGEISMGGSTVSNAEDALATTLSEFLRDEPSVTISVQQLAGNKIYILGKVNRPGEYPINAPTDVMQALSMAGGLSTFASENGIKILRRDESDDQVVIPFKYGKVKNGDNLDMNIILNSSDVIVVP